MKKTLASELIAAGYDLLQHFRDSRAGGRTRHKVWIGRPDRNQLEQSDIGDIDTIVGELIPKASPYGPRRGRFIEFTWTTEPGESSAVGTPFTTRMKRRVHKGCRLSGYLYNNT